MSNVFMHPARLYDTLRNFVSGLGTQKDPRTASFWDMRILDRNMIEQAYRSDWLARRLVDLPATDATREWRTWQANPKQLQAIDRLEKKLFLRHKMMQAIQKARLYGGAALVLGVDVGQPEDELDPDDVGKDDLQFAVVLNRYELNAGPRIYNVASPYYTRPEYYTVATPMFGFYGEEGGSYPTDPAQQNLVQPPRMPEGRAPPLFSDPKLMNQPSYGMIRIHPSRVVEFAGNPLPDWRLAPMGGGWGDSVLQTIDDSLRDFAMIMGGLASVINDMKMDVVSVPELSRHLGTADMTQKFIERWSIANQAKSTINTLMIDTNEKWERIQTSFGGTPDLIRVAMQVSCAAGGVPMSRVMGQAPNKGLGTESGNETDLRGYYDDISALQHSDYRRIMYILDRVIVAAATGENDEDIDNQWNPLFKENPAEQATVALNKAQATQIYVNLGLINEDALREGVVSQLTEDKTYPALEQAIEEFGAEPEEPPAPPQQMLPTPPPGMLNKGQFDPNPFHMLRAQQAAKSGQPIRVPPHPPRKPGIPAPQQPQQGKDSYEWLMDWAIENLTPDAIRDTLLSDDPLAAVLDAATSLREGRIELGLDPDTGLTDAWSDEARQASAEVRRAHAHGQHVTGVQRGQAAAAARGQTFSLYHGSRHDFDHFDSRHIGSGEGAQIYGRGIYLAENPSVSKGYEHAGEQGLGATYKGQSSTDLSRKTATVNSIAAQHAMEHMRSGASAEQAIARTAADFQRGKGVAHGEDPSQYVKAAQALNPKHFDAGTHNLYKVNVHANPDHFVDFDRPLSGQSEHVRNALQSSGVMRGADPHVKVGAVIQGHTGRDAAQISARLHQAGIEGVKYRAGQTSGAHAGPSSHNWVVFDPGKLEITHKNGVRLHDAEVDDFNPYHDPKSGRFTSAQSEAHAVGTSAVAGVLRAAEVARRKRSASAKAAHARRKAHEAEPFPLPKNATPHQAGITAVSRALAVSKGLTKGEMAKAAKEDIKSAVEEFAATQNLKDPKAPLGMEHIPVDTAYRLGVTFRRFIREPESRKVMAQALTHRSMDWLAETPGHAAHLIHHSLMDTIEDHVSDLLFDAVVGGAIGWLVGGPAGGAIGSGAAEELGKTPWGAALNKAIKSEVEIGMEKIVEDTGLTADHLRYVVGGIGHVMAGQLHKWKLPDFHLHLPEASSAATVDAEPDDTAAAAKPEDYDLIERALLAFDDAVAGWEPDE